MDKALNLCIVKLVTRNATISDLQIKQRATRSQDSVDKASEVSEKMKLLFSNGWIKKFKMRHGFRRIFMQREQASASSAALVAPPGIRKQLNAYSRENIFNGNKFGLQFRLSANRTIAVRQLSGWKNNTKIVCLACCNATGFDVYPLRIVDYFKCPRAFQQKSGEDLEIEF